MKQLTILARIFTEVVGICINLCSIPKKENIQFVTVCATSLSFLYKQGNYSLLSLNIF